MIGLLGSLRIQNVVKRKTIERKVAQNVYYKKLLGLLNVGIALLFFVNEKNKNWLQIMAFQEFSALHNFRNFRGRCLQTPFIVVIYIFKFFEDEQWSN
ncbi:MAG TPA: hypothetical protein VK469_19100 [Candidatus Kapabacteria bacterium]|nr:hypothetical protein [Candidatus Kapabacteria bacterium]